LNAPGRLLSCIATALAICSSFGTSTTRSGESARVARPQAGTGGRGAVDRGNAFGSIALIEDLDADPRELTQNVRLLAAITPLVQILGMGIDPTEHAPERSLAQSVRSERMDVISLYEPHRPSMRATSEPEGLLSCSNAPAPSRDAAIRPAATTPAATTGMRNVVMATPFPSANLAGLTVDAASDAR
jgi:hypothetical protein